MFASKLIATSPFLFACAFYGCQKAQPEAAEAVAAPAVALAEPKLSAQAVPAANTEAPGTAPVKIPAEWAKGPSNDPVGYPRDGWSKLTLDDTLPLCVFSDFAQREAAQFLAQVRPQKLAAKNSVVFGAFGPACINPDCDDLPTLQCSVERQGSTLHVKAHYWAYHKQGATCSTDCAEVTAGCASPELEAGKYTVRYGDKTYTLRIPSKLSSPCFK